MVIELTGVQFGLKSYAWFQNWTSAQRDKLHDTKFNCHVITTIFNRLGQYQYFIDPVAGLLKAEPETLLPLILYAKHKKMQFTTQNIVIRE